MMSLVNTFDNLTGNRRLSSARKASDSYEDSSGFVNLLVFACKKRLSVLLRPMCWKANTIFECRWHTYPTPCLPDDVSGLPLLRPIGAYFHNSTRVRKRVWLHLH